MFPLFQKDQIIKNIDSSSFYYPFILRFILNKQVKLIHVSLHGIKESLHKTDVLDTFLNKLFFQK